MEFAFNRPLRTDDSYLNQQRQEFFFDHPLYRARRRGWYTRPLRHGARGARTRGDPRGQPRGLADPRIRSEEHTSELQSQSNLVCRLLLEKKKKDKNKLPRNPNS